MLMGWCLELWTPVQSAVVSIFLEAIATSVQETYLHGPSVPIPLTHQREASGSSQKNLRTYHSCKTVLRVCIVNN